MRQQGVIGLIGGLSWESSAEYYRIINRKLRERCGGVRSARCLMWSFDFGEVEALQHAGRWDELTGLMTDAAWRLSRLDEPRRRLGCCFIFAMGSSRDAGQVQDHRR